MWNRGERDEADGGRERKEAVSPVVARSPGKEVGEGGGKRERSVKTPGDHRAMEAIRSIGWKGEIRDSRTFHALLPGLRSGTKKWICGVPSKHNRSCDIENQASCFRSRLAIIECIRQFLIGMKP